MAQMDERIATGEIDRFIGRTVLSQFRLETKLGEGGQASVYLARHRHLPESLYAVKVLANHSIPDARARFDQEIRVTAMLESSRVVRPVDFGEWEDGIPYYVMEYVRGRGLDAEIRALGVIPVCPALLIALRIADTLAHAHARNVVHRDIKPPNVMIVSGMPNNPRIKILDWGVAQVGADIKLAHTRVGSAVGSAGYISPECATGDGCDGRADLFSLGCLLFQMLTGAVPWPAESFVESITRAIRDPAPSLASRGLAHLEPHLSTLEPLIDVALAKARNARCFMDEYARMLASAIEAVQRQGDAAPMPAQWLSVVASPDAAPAASNDEHEDAAALIRRFATPQTAGRSAPPDAVTVAGQPAPGAARRTHVMAEPRAADAVTRIGPSAAPARPAKRSPRAVAAGAVAAALVVVALATAAWIAARHDGAGSPGGMTRIATTPPATASTPPAPPATAATSAGETKPIEPPPVGVTAPSPGAAIGGPNVAGAGRTQGAMAPTGGSRRREHHHRERKAGDHAPSDTEEAVKDF
jgi:serine/threonine-protein kinase